MAINKIYRRFKGDRVRYHHVLKKKLTSNPAEFRNAKSPSMIARKLAESLSLGADDTLKVIDESGLVRRNFRTVTDSEGTRVESYEMPLSELVDEFLNQQS